MVASLSLKHDNTVVINSMDIFSLIKSGHLFYASPLLDTLYHIHVIDISPCVGYN
jgi:hypothetical protein